MGLIAIFVEQELHLAQTLKDFIQTYAPVSTPIDILLSKNPVRTPEAFRVGRLQEHLQDIEGIYHRSPPSDTYRLLILLDDGNSNFLPHSQHRINLSIVEDTEYAQIQELKKAAAKIVGNHLM